MKYIIYMKELIPFLGWQYKRVEIKDDEKLKNFLFKNKDNLSNIEIFTKENKCKIEFNIIIN